ncbi:MAG TPA: cation transporting ATPase C-terminal domain-containing protein, partial [Polyangia bacterium]
LITFAVLWWGFRASAAVFQTAWFVESLLTELVIAMVVRTWRPFFRSRPGSFLLTSTLVLMVVTPLIPWLPYAGTLGFVTLPSQLVGSLLGITVAYAITCEGAKRRFARRLTWLHPVEDARGKGAPGFR